MPLPLPPLQHQRTSFSKVSLLLYPVKQLSSLHAAHQGKITRTQIKCTSSHIPSPPNLSSPLSLSYSTLFHLSPSTPLTTPLPLVNTQPLPSTLLPSILPSFLPSLPLSLSPSLPSSLPLSLSPSLPSSLPLFNSPTHQMQVPYNLPPPLAPPYSALPLPLLPPTHHSITTSKLRCPMNTFSYTSVRFTM